MTNEEQSFVHPYIPNSVPGTRREMLNTIGVDGVEELYVDIPENLRYRKPLKVPAPFLSEYDLERHVKEILCKNLTCDEYLSFLGAGCYQHYVPAVCDEIISRGEFLTAYAGMSYTDVGKFQAIFEYVSMLTELLGMEVAGMPTYDGSSAGSTAVRMAARITGRPEILVPETMSRQGLEHMKNYCRNSEVKEIIPIKYEHQSGLMDLEDLRTKLSSKSAGVFIENPSCLGVIESQAREIASMAHGQGALLIASVNPISLGVLAPPGDYGADIACGNAQPLGVHMNCGGGSTGFVAVKDVPEHVGELPGMLITILDLIEGDGFTFHSFALPERLSYTARENAKEFTGTNTVLWSIANAVYMALMGPQGMRAIGETIISKSHYARKRIAEVPRTRIPLGAAHFNEFVVNFDDTSKSVAEINKGLLDHRIFGGKDLSEEFPALGNSALYCVTERHSMEDIHKLVEALKEVVA